jgi:hypothetical protein
MLYRPFPTIRGPCTGTGIAPRKDLPDPMSEQTTVSQANVGSASVSQARAADGPGALRIIGLAAVGVGLAALAGAAFVLSYAGIHAFALEAGISARLARGYPLIFDVLLVVILAAVLALRGAGLPSKLLAWACLLALLAAAAGADALHAAGRKLPAQNAAVTAAIVPWVLVLIALVLLLAMLRHARLRRVAANQAAANRSGAHGEASPRWDPQQPPPSPSLPLIPGFGPQEPAALARPTGISAVEQPSVGQPAVEGPWPVVPRQLTAESAADTAGLPGRNRHSDNGAHGAELAVDAEPAPDDPSSDETPMSLDDSAGADDADGQHDSAEDTSPDDETADPEMPVFHRMWSSPVPPASD